MANKSFFRKQSEHAIDMFGKWKNRSLLDDVYSSPYRQLSLDNLEHWIPVVLKVYSHDTHHFHGWYACMMREFPHVVNQNRGYCELNGPISIATKYIEDIEIAFNDTYYSKLVTKNLIDAQIMKYDRCVSHPYSYNNDLDAWRTKNELVDVEIYPYWFSYKPYFMTIEDWKGEMHSQHIIDIASINNLPHCVLKKVSLGVQVGRYSVALNANTVTSVIVTKSRVMDPTYEYIENPSDTEKREYDRIQKEVNMFFDSTISTSDINDAILKKDLVSEEKVGEHDEILDNDLLLI